MQYFDNRAPGPIALCSASLSLADPIGLFLNYELCLPASTHRDVVARKLTDLHAFSQSIGFEELSPMLVDEGESEEDNDRLGALRFLASVIADVDNAEESSDEPAEAEPGGLEIVTVTYKPAAAPRRNYDLDSSVGFIVQPGRGCETATFALMRRADSDGANPEWFWRCFCKTQYASVVSDEHLIKCHTGLVRVLDHAIELGINVTVDDETHYWETRDASRLVEEVRKMNQLIAGFAGKLSDAMGDKDLHASIFEHPRFERLEMGEGE